MQDYELIVFMDFDNSRNAQSIIKCRHGNGEGNGEGNSIEGDNIEVIEFRDAIDANSMPDCYSPSWEGDGWGFPVRTS